MAGLIVFSERDEVRCELLSKGRELAALLNVPLAAALLVSSGADTAKAAAECGAFGAEKVYAVEDSRLSTFRVEQYADTLAAICRTSGSTIVLLGSTKRGKELAGRIAQKLGCGAVTDAVGLQVSSGKLVAERYGLGGNTMASDVITSESQVIAVMPRTFETSRHPGAGQLVRVEAQISEPRVKAVESKPKPAATANIESAESLVVIGKGVAKQEDVLLAQALAQALGGELGCTRALSSDYHWLGEERMIGISGKKVKPRLMVSVGVSGQIQHTVSYPPSSLWPSIGTKGHRFSRSRTMGLWETCTR